MRSVASMFATFFWRADWLIARFCMATFFVDKQVKLRGFGTNSDADLLQLLHVLIKGASSDPPAPVEDKCHVCGQSSGHNYSTSLTTQHPKDSLHDDNAQN